MLPKLTEKRSVTFQAATVEPVFVSARRNVLHELKNVEEIRVSVIGKGKYTVEVFTDSSHCWLTANTSSTSTLSASAEALTSQDESCLQQPIVRMKRELYEFVDLRNKVYNNVFMAHSTQYCKFCLGILEAVVNGVDHGGVFFAVFGDRRVARKLTTFMEDLMRTMKHADANIRGCCSAQVLVPEAVHGFLFKPSPSTTNST